MNSVGRLENRESLEHKKIRELFVCRRDEIDGISESLTHVINNYLEISGIKAKVYNRYLASGLSDEEFKTSMPTIFSEKPVDNTFSKEDFFNEVLGCGVDDLELVNITKTEKGSDKEIVEGIYYKVGGGKTVLNIEALPGQYDARVDAVKQLLMAQTSRNNHNISAQTTIVLDGELSIEDIQKIRKWIINPVDKCDSQLGNYENRPIPLEDKWYVMDGFCSLDNEGLRQFLKDQNLAMDLDDISLVQTYFRDEENRNPTNVELEVIDTYWSDHCRHTTFNTVIEDVIYMGLGQGGLIDYIKSVEAEYKKDKGDLGRGAKPDTLMGIVTLPKRYFQANSEKNLSVNIIDESEEINACSFKIKVELEDGTKEEYLIMYKNETHNHPTEIEPFGGAATCLGGCIRDPMSGRAWVFGAMRVSGSADPTEPVSATIAGKLSQLLISQLAASGYSSYGNQIGIHTGIVQEFFHPGFKAKRFEVGYVIGGTPLSHVKREKPKNGDIVLMIGGRIGSDGVKGASGASSTHNELTVANCGTQVQKGNPVTERALAVLFLNSEFSKLIRRCNDFGAGGVAVAVGELSRGLDIELDNVKTKYPIGALVRMISESQERMAVVIDKEDYDEAMKLINEVNLEAVKIATVTDSENNPEQDRLSAKYKGDKVVDISRNFLDQAGAKKKTVVGILPTRGNYFDKLHDKELQRLLESWKIKEAFLYNLNRLSVASQKGLGSIFDNSVGSSSVLAPFGGKNQLTHQIGMVCKVPTSDGVDAKTTTISSFGFNPDLGVHSPFLSGIYAIVESVSKCIALGGNMKQTFLSLQEYFEKLGTDPLKWGKAYEGMLGAYVAQKELGIIALGGKDSMSGTYTTSDGIRMDVPPSIVSFATSIGNINKTISAEFKKPGSPVVYFPVPKDENGVPNWKEYSNNLEIISTLIKRGYVSASSTAGFGGLTGSIHNMCVGNDIGFQFDESEGIFAEDMGGIILELNVGNLEEINNVVGEDSNVFKVIGKTLDQKEIIVDNTKISLDMTKASWTERLEKVFPTNKGGSKVKLIQTGVQDVTTRTLVDLLGKPLNSETVNVLVTPPKVLIPVFPGTNSELDTHHAVKKAGMEPTLFYFNTLTADSLMDSTKRFIELLKEAQMVVFPGGFSAGDEPDGSAKYISTLFRMQAMKDAMNAFLGKSDTLTLGICNGFQALIKLGVFDKGEITDFLKEDDFTLTNNEQHRHITDNVGLVVNSILSPFMSFSQVGDHYVIPVSHGEGRLYIAPEHIGKLKQYIDNGQVVMQYVDFEGNPTSEYNGSLEGIASICSFDGRILGLMPHPERTGEKLFQNIPGNHDLPLFRGAASALGVKKRK